MNENEYVSAKGKTYKAAAALGACHGCAFQHKNRCPTRKKVKGPSCIQGYRSDGRNIIWVKEE